MYTTNELLTARRGPNGYKVIVSHSLETKEQFRFPISRSRRIRRKWEKRPCNYRLRWNDQIYVNERDRTMILSPRVWEKMKAQIDKENLI